MKLHLTILLSALIIATGLTLLSRQAHDTPRYFAADLLPSEITISRADVIKAVNGLDRAKLLANIVPAGRRATEFRSSRCESLAGSKDDWGLRRGRARGREPLPHGTWVSSATISARGQPYIG